MRHAILGAGGVGGLVGGALAQSGRPVLLVLRPETRELYPGGLHIQSPLLGEFDVDVPAAVRLDREVDVLWVTVKATQLDEALPVAAPAVAGHALVVPLLNGIDHMARLRAVFGDLVVAGAIRVESERVGPAHIVHLSPFASIDLAPSPELRERADVLADEVRAAGLSCNVRDSEADVLWGKLAILAPMALATTSAGGAMGAVRDDPELRDLMLGCAREVCAVAESEGVGLDPEIPVQALLGLPSEFRSSMQKDVAAGRAAELDAIAGPVLRRGRRLGIPTPATEELARRVAASTDAREPGRLGWVR
jgi:2-dehydropantoate 2-reductase